MSETSESVIVEELRQGIKLLDRMLEKSDCIIDDAGDLACRMTVLTETLDGQSRRLDRMHSRLERIEQKIGELGERSTPSGLRAAPW